LKLDVDLRADTSARLVGGPDLTAHQVIEAVKRPRSLPRLLWARHIDRLRVNIDELPMGVTQAVALAVLGFARASRFAVSTPGGEAEMGRAAFLARGTFGVAAAIANELISLPRLYRIARRSAIRETAVPREVSDPRSVLYLRAEPSLRWMGQMVGGAATHTSGVINGFRANGLEATVVAAERPAGTDGIPFHAAPFTRMSRLIPGLTYAEYSQDLLEAASRLRADFVYQRYALGSTVGIQVAARLGVPLVLEFNGSEVWVERNWGSGHVRMGRTLEAIERRNLLDASLVVVVAEPLKAHVVAQSVDPLRVLVNPNGVDVERLEPYRARPSGEWRRRLGLAESPTVGFIGTFGPWHGVTVLPEMIAGLRKLVPDARWILIGAGQLKRRVSDEIERRGLADRASMLGLVPHQRALELLAACDVCVSPHVPNPDGTPFFGSPTKLFEYMGLAKPIVASDLDQIGEVLEHEETGILCPPGDAGAAAAAAAELLEDPGKCSRLGEAALERARSDYSWKAHTRRILDALAGGA
jgi:glycosyltransferase involved in cell wall biosynthesis